MVTGAPLKERLNMKLLPKLAVIACAMVATTALAADHRDGDGVKADPASDINDVYAFTEGNNVVLAMTVSPFADKATAKFSDVTQYVFHVSSWDKFGGTQSSSTMVMCTFAADQTLQCWVGDATTVKDYVTGKVTSDAGITSADGKVKVFAGPRADPFYFYLTGFNAARSAALGAINGGMVMLNPNGCPALTGPTVTALDGLLHTDVQANNDFAMANVLGLSLEIDKNLLIKNPDEVISVWASTNK
jgi:hypothetical protein